MAAEKAVLANKPRNLIPMGIIQTGEYTAQNELRFVKGIGSHVRDSPTTRVTKMHTIYCGLIRDFILYVALITLSIVVGLIVAHFL